MKNARFQRDLDELARDLDLLAFSLEQAPAPPPEQEPRELLRAVGAQVERLARRLRELADRAASP